MNKVAGMTLEGGLHVWDCRQLDVSGRLAEVKSKVGSSTVWTGRHSPHNRELLMVGAGGGALSLYQYHYPDNRVASDTEGNKSGVAGSLTQLQTQQISDQPVNSLDWSQDKNGLLVTSAFDQRIRIVIVTKLHLI